MANVAIAGGLLGSVEGSGVALAVERLQGLGEDDPLLEEGSGDLAEELLLMPALPPPSQKKKLVIFYGSQTGTAEDYGTRIAKEAKARYGHSSLVCDPEE